jgi:hypothetical protein
MAASSFHSSAGVMGQWQMSDLSNGHRPKRKK